MRSYKKGRLQILIGSVAVVILVGSQYLNDILNLYIGTERGFFTPIIALVAVLFLIGIFSGRTIIRNRYPLLLIMIIIIAYVLTAILQPGKSTLSPVDLFGMCLLPIAVGSFLVIDYKMVFRGCMLLLLLIIPVYGKVFLKANSGLLYNAVSMSTSYNILPITIAALIYLIYFGKNSKILDIILYVLSFVCTLSLIRMSYRGAFLALYVSFFLAFYYRKKRESYKNKLIILLSMVIIGFLIIYMQHVLSFVSSILKMVNIRIAFIDKTIYLLAHESLGHGRLEIYRLAFKGFASSPIWGNGLATFQYYTGYPFPHNFVLEFLFDGGIMLFIPMAFFFTHSLHNLLSSAWTGDRYRFAFTLMIASISITRGLISAESWRIVLLWLFVGLTFNKNRSTLFYQEQL